VRYLGNFLQEKRLWPTLRSTSIVCWLVEPDRRNALRSAVSQPCGDKLGVPAFHTSRRVRAKVASFPSPPIHIAMPKLCLGTTGLFSTKIGG
jgi:hypothetical protein